LLFNTCVMTENIRLIFVMGTNKFTLGSLQILFLKTSLVHNLVSMKVLNGTSSVKIAYEIKDSFWLIKILMANPLYSPDKVTMQTAMVMNVPRSAIIVMLS
jgi:hypothetical protein